MSLVDDARPREPAKSEIQRGNIAPRPWRLAVPFGIAYSIALIVFCLVAQPDLGFVPSLYQLNSYSSALKLTHGW